MADSSRKTDLENLISYCDDLSRVLKDRKDMNNLAYCLQQSQALQSSCDTHSSEVQSFLQDYQRKIDECKEKTEAAISKVVVDVELDQLERELHEELAKERLLMENMRDIENEIDLLDHQQISIEEKRQTLKKLEQYEQRQQMTLSMYASVTNIIPKLEDDSKTADIVDRKKILIDKFEFNSSEVSGYEVCHKIWKMIDIPSEEIVFLCKCYLSMVTAWSIV